MIPGLTEEETILITNLQTQKGNKSKSVIFVLQPTNSESVCKFRILLLRMMGNLFYGTGMIKLKKNQKMISLAGYLMMGNLFYGTGMIKLKKNQKMIS